MICCLAAAWLFGGLVLGLRAVRRFISKGSALMRRTSRALWLGLAGTGLLAASGAAAWAARPAGSANSAHDVSWILAHLPMCGDHNGS